MFKHILMKRIPLLAVAAALHAAGLLTGCGDNEESAIARSERAAPGSYAQAGFPGNVHPTMSQTPAGRPQTMQSSGSYAPNAPARDSYGQGGYTSGGQPPGSNAPGAAPRYAPVDPAARAPQPGRADSPGLDELMAWERQDAGVRPTRELRAEAMHAPTPNQIPGGQVITTKGLVPLLQQQIAVHVFDVLGSGKTLPNAIPAVWAAEPGSFEDRTQQQFAQMLEQVTRGDAAAPLVFYCQGPQCWMSYNAALRAIALGYRNVLWYRGGMEAWGHAGLPFASSASSTAPRRG